MALVIIIYYYAETAQTLREIHTKKEYATGYATVCYLSVCPSQVGRMAGSVNSQRILPTTPICLTVLVTGPTVTQN